MSTAARVFIFALAASACTEAARDAAPASPGPSVSAEAAPAAPADASRIVAVGGPVKETVYALGLGDRVVGSDASSLYPEAVLALPRLNYFRQTSAEGVLPQESGLAFGLTALDVVLLGRTPWRASHRGDLAAAQHAMAQAGVEHLAKRRYPTLSGGERQRVHLARALAQIDGPTPGDGAPAGRYLLLDEPTSALDLGHQHAVLQTARRVATEGVGVLTVLHDLNLAAQYTVLTPTVVRCAFGITVVATAHPCAACPLAVPVPGDGAVAFDALT